MPENSPASTLSPRIARVLELAQRLAPERNRWIERNAFFYGQDEKYMRFLVPEGLRVLDLGCGTGRMLAALKPARGVGVDISSNMIEIARRDFPGLEFVAGDVEDPAVVSSLTGPFDVIVLSDTIGTLEDC